MNNTAEPIGPGAAIRAILRAQSVRIYAETPIISLLGLEDELGARIEWKKRLSKREHPPDQKALDGVRNEISRRASTEIASGNEDFAKQNKIATYLPDEGKFRRDLYPKHLAFYAAGKIHRERGAFGANRAGKTMMCGAEVTWHITGRYPHWWNGIVFDEALDAWIANKSAKDVRDINEAELIGHPGDVSRRGTGLIPGHLISKLTPKPGVPSAFEFIDVRHVSGAISQIQSKSFDQGREAFQGRSRKLIWLDEECPAEIYTECLLRTLDCGGIVILSYTPIEGLTELTVQFLEEAGITIDMIGKDAEESESVSVNT